MELIKIKKLVKISNSYYILVPKIWLDINNIKEKKVKMIVRENEIIIKTIKDGKTNICK